MKWWWFLIIFFLAVIQTTFLKYLEINGVVPNILLVLAVLFIIFYDFDNIWLYLIFIGFILDFFSDSQPGTNLMALMITAAIFLFFIKDFFNRKSAFPGIFLGFLGLLFFYLFSIGLTALFANWDNFSAADFIPQIMSFFFTGIIYNFFIFIAVFILGRRLKFLNVE